MMDDQERISDELQLFSISLHALTELAGQVLSCIDDISNIFLCLCKLSDSIDCAIFPGCFLKYSIASRFQIWG